MEFGSLEDICRRLAVTCLPEQVLQVVAHDALLALVALDSLPHPIIHRDIKPSNLLVNANGQVKLSDFNTARVVAETRKITHTYLGVALLFVIYAHIQSPLSLLFFL